MGSLIAGVATGLGVIAAYLYGKHDGRREERERCAGIAQAVVDMHDGEGVDTGRMWQRAAAARIVTAIRGSRP